MPPGRIGRMLGWGGMAALAFVLYVFLRGCAQDVVTRPEMQVRVVDSRGRPIADAQVTFLWWSVPHQRHEDRDEFRTGTEGTLSFEKVTRELRVYPLCMHGVPSHRWTLCVAAPGHRDLVVELSRAQESFSFDLPLIEGEPQATCRDWNAIDRRKDEVAARRLEGAGIAEAADVVKAEPEAPPPAQQQPSPSP